jgi:PAS domain S-box-containing protein
MSQPAPGPVAPRDEALRQSEERYRLLVESVRDYAIFMLDPAGHITTWSAGAEHIKGYRPPEVLGRHFSCFYTPEDVAAGRPQRLLGIATAEGRVEDQGWRVRKDGARFWANVVITALRDEAGRLVGYAKVVRDLTERRNAEEVLRESEERFRLMVETVRDYAIFMLDPAGHVLTWNEGARHLKGYAAEEILGRHFSVFYPPEDVAGGKTEHELRVAAAEGRFEDEGWRVRKDGARFWANVVLTALRDADGRLRGFIKVTRDLTQRRQAEEQRLQLVRAREARAAAEERVRARDRFLSIASHELRTPLNPLLITLQVLVRAAHDDSLHGRLAGRAAEMLESCERQARHFAHLINDLLDMSRLASGRLDLHLQDADLAAVVRGVLTRFGPELAQAGCALTLRTDGAVVGRWDRSRLDQVVTNLLTNALKYGRGKPVEVALEAGPAAARLTVRDHGIGIAAADHERIFVQFERAVTGPEYGGLGMGLYIVRQLVEAQGGTVRVASEPGSGATFTVELPYAGPAASSSAGPC